MELEAFKNIKLKKKKKQNWKVILKTTKLMSLNIDEKKTIQRDKHSKYKTHD